MIKCICGLPGSGKNQYSTKLAIKAMQDGYRVYSTYPIKTKILSLNKENLFKRIEVRTFELSKDKFLKGDFEPGSILLFDEAWLDFFNMDWKKVKKEELRKYNGSRHLGITLYYITQSPHRIIPYLRDVTDSYIWIERKLLWNKLTEYYEIENVGKLVGEDMGMLSPRLVKQSIYIRNRRIMTSYNDVYLKNSVILEGKTDKMHDTFNVEYRHIFKRIFRHYKRKLNYRKELTEDMK